MEAISKAQQIRTLLSQGISISEIAEKVGVKMQYVYDVRNADRRKAKRVARNKKAVTEVKTTVVARAPEAGKIESMQKYIMHLETELLMRDGAINALRNKLYAASV